MRCARSTGPVVLALLLVCVWGLVFVAPAATAATTGAASPAARSAATAPALSLVSQSPWVTAGQPWHVQLSLGALGPLSSLRLVMTVDEEVRDRSTFVQTLTGADERELDQPQDIALTAGHLTLALPVVTGSGATPTGSPEIDLQCPDLPGYCQGVYPVSFELERAASGSVVGRVQTYVTYVEGVSSSRLRLALVVPFRAPVSVRRTPDPASALPAATPAQVARLGALAQVLAHGTAPVTVEVNPRTVQALREANSPAAQATLTSLDQQSSSAPADPEGSEWPTGPYVPIDVGAMAGAGLTGEIQLQMARGSDELRGTVRAAAAPLTWVDNGPVGSGLAEGLADAHADSVVIPDTDLASDPMRLGITQPFDLALARGAPVQAAASDTGLSSLFDAQPADPALAATQLLAELALIHFEEPNAAESRGVVVVAPSGWSGDPRFIDTLVSGLPGNPVVSAVTLSQFFSQVPPGGAHPTWSRPCAISVPVRVRCCHGPSPGPSPPPASARTPSRARCSASPGCWTSSPTSCWPPNPTSSPGPPPPGRSPPTSARWPRSWPRSSWPPTGRSHSPPAPPPSRSPSSRRPATPWSATWPSPVTNSSSPRGPPGPVSC